MNLITGIIVMSIALAINGAGNSKALGELQSYTNRIVESDERCAQNISEYEYNLLLRVCMSECGGKYGEPLEGKIAVVETILNRCEMYGKSIEEVVYQPNQYSTAYNGEPDEYVKEAVDIALREKSYPSNMIYFRAGNYHDFGIPYKQIGNHYFSLEESE